MGAIGEKDSVAKGPVTRCLDVLSVAEDGCAKLKKLRDAVAGLAGNGYVGLENVFAEDLFAVCDMRPKNVTRAKEYLRDYWFNEENGWWQDEQPVVRTFAVGLLTALDASLAGCPNGKAIPMDCYWIVGHKEVELITLVSPRQVTLLFATPEPADRKPGKIWSEWSNAFVTGRRDGQVETRKVDKVG